MTNIRHNQTMQDSNWPTMIYCAMQYAMWLMLHFQIFMLQFSQDMLCTFSLHAQFFHVMLYMPYLLMIVLMLVDGECVLEALQGYLNLNSPWYSLVFLILHNYSSFFLGFWITLLCSYIFLLVIHSIFIHYHPYPYLSYPLIKACLLSSKVWPSFSQLYYIKCEVP